MTNKLDDMIARLRKIAGPETMAQVAQEAAPLCNAAILASSKAGTSPDGKPWAPKKDGTGRPLENASSHVQTTAHGPIIRMTLSGPDVYHNFGAGAPKRQIIPDSSGTEPLPEPIEEAIQLACHRVLAKIVGSGH